jgi:hypothetical protein
MARTIVYIDGFNLYYRALKGTAHKWLDIAAMSAACLPTGYQIQAINYYTAHISGRLDPTAPARQQTYLRALESLPKVAIFTAIFLWPKNGLDWFSRWHFGRRSLYRQEPLRR